MKKQLINQMLQIARKRLTKHHEFNNFIHYSFIVSKGQIIEYAENANLEPRKNLGYHSRIKSESFKPKFHSELFCYRRAKGLLRGKSFEVVNFRFNKKGDLRLSKPCSVCYRILSLVGCKSFYYSGGIGDRLLQIKGKPNAFVR